MKNESNNFQELYMTVFFKSFGELLLNDKPKERNDVLRSSATVYCIRYSFVFSKE